ncbi:acetate/propionate family kinase [Silvibacterium sp.]|uniref:acetate/propionate family kinase n=1 Tax=Silvibacterium sp. TaxID=1964179 RepID=UPI0039E49717
MNILVFNPGGHSLKVELICAGEHQARASEGTKLLSLSIEGIGSEHTTLARFHGKKVVESTPIQAADLEQAVQHIFSLIEEHATDKLPRLEEIEAVGLRVVHGGPHLVKPVIVDAEVEHEIEAQEKLAPLHNKSSIEVLGPIRSRLRNVPIVAVFDSAFHHDLPEYAALYPLPLELSRKHGIRRYGFHGISHSWMLHRYAELTGRAPEDCNLVTMHLESGCSVTAIHKGRSIDNTMGLTPLEGLMMGTRCGDIDPAILPFLVREEQLSLDEVMEILNHKSGLQGVSGSSLDTRVLMQHYYEDPRARLAMDMFCYRVRKAVGAHLAALGEADAVVFGGGIAENTPLLRTRVADGLRPSGFVLDELANHTLIDLEGRVAGEGSSLDAWVIPVEEGLEIAHAVVAAVAVPSVHTEGAIPHA